MSACMQVLFLAFTKNGIMKPIILCLTHSNDSYTIDLVQQHLTDLGYQAIRFNSDDFPLKLEMAGEISNEKSSTYLRHNNEWIDLSLVKGIWLRKNFPSNLIKKIALIKTLLRKEFYSAKPSKDINKEINLLIIGGSQGAKLFDTVINDSIIKLSKKYELKIFQQTNFENYKSIKNFYSKNNIENELFDFKDNISDFMSKANISVTRAGASTLAELIFLNVAFIAIPLPFAKDNHQFQNASFYESQGCNWILNQSELNESSLTDKLINIIENKEEYLDKKKNMRNFSYQNTWNNINQKIITIINEN